MSEPSCYTNYNKSSSGDVPDKGKPHLSDWLEAGLKIFTVKINIQCWLPFLELSIYLFGKVQIQMAWSNGDLLSHPSKAQNQS